LRRGDGMVGMTERIRLTFINDEGALVRILGLVERRGYRLDRVVAEEGTLTLSLTPRDPGRRLDVLAAQLRRLHDVTDVTPFPSMQSAA
ncbi:MAG: ACT domain-containing protein, partial [Pseudomonadota bacterium]